MTAYLLTIGDEILIGQITDTNSAWMAQQLNLQGIRIAGKASVGDVHEEIVESVRYALSKADLVLMTGGLGATKDDITKKALADYFNVPMVFHDETYERMVGFFKKINRTVSEMNKNGCFMPQNAVILNNDRGLAPAMWFDTEGGKSLVSMPGVPHEMQHLMRKHVLPRLREHFPMSPIVHRTLLTSGEGETMLAEKLSNFEDALPDNVKLAYLPSLGTVRLRLTARGNNEAALHEQLDELKVELEKIVGYAVAGYDEDTMPIVIGRMLVERGLKLGVAESCTGGYLSHLLTTVSGCSTYFEGSTVVYSYELKEKLLDVSKTMLDTEGAVSENCVREMVTGTLDRLGVDVAVAVSGIAGPLGGTPDKPVGTVWIAVGNRVEMITYKISLDRGRLKNIEYAANTALNLLRKFLLHNIKATEKA
ncbi:MAG: CinA family nicotinamide mononucleotide deamidase-related protein [Saprospiraceae bacterium]|nr:CinA family nicotinamide mononucleotide deamidase-related protein [Saprospiraceae bacterium]